MSFKIFIFVIESIHMSFQTREANGYQHYLESVVILHLSRDSHPRRSGCRA